MGNGFHSPRYGCGKARSAPRPVRTACRASAASSDCRIVRIRRVIALEHLVFDGGQRHIAANQRIEFADTLARRLYRISGSLRKFRNLEYIERQALELRRSQQPVILFEGRRGEFDVQVGGLQLGASVRGCPPPRRRLAALNSSS